MTITHPGGEPHRAGVAVFGADHRLRCASPGFAALSLLPASTLIPGTPRADIEQHIAAHSRSSAGLILQQLPLDDGGCCLSLSVAAPEGARFLATMSHELRTPLNVVIGFADALLSEQNLTAGQVAEFAASIRAGGHALLGLVNNLLDVAHIEQGRLKLQSDTIDIAHLADLSLGAVTEPARKARIHLTAEILTGTARLSADERRMRQVLHQLLTNALAFTPAGGRVSLRIARDPEGGLQMLVQDSGIGIAPDHLAHVFEPFTQADGGLARRTTGAGLGLFVCRALVAAQGGTLSLKSTLGRGTTAIVSLPATRLIEPNPSLALLQE